MKKLGDIELRYHELPAALREELHELGTEIFQLLAPHDLPSGLAIGNFLRKAKERLEHGQFRAFLKVELQGQIKLRSAENFMKAQRLAAAFVQQGKNANFANLGRAAMYLLTAENVPEAVAHGVLEMTNFGPVTYTEVLKATAPYRAQRKAEKDAKRNAKKAAADKAASDKAKADPFKSAGAAYSLSMNPTALAAYTLQIISDLDTDGELSNDLATKLRPDDIMWIFRAVTGHYLAARLPPDPPAPPPPEPTKPKMPVGSASPTYFGR